MATKEEKELYKKWQLSPLLFIKHIWKLAPQETKEDEFIKGKHLTWQQYELLKAVEDAINGRGLKRISVVSGKGTGKSTTLAWIILWFLFCHVDAQVPCTAPSADQMYDVLWKELASWLRKMPEQIQSCYELSTEYLRIREQPDTWFARAKTARKEKPEALQGIHGDHVLYIVDEASGVDDVIFSTAEGSLTNKNILMIMISNGTRNVGYFFESHHKDQKSWNCLSFNGEESPIVDKEFVDRIISKWGKDSDEYLVQVKGGFPRVDAIDKSGYSQLIYPEHIRTTQNNQLIGRRRLGIDPAGEGKDKTVWVIRDRFKARIYAVEKYSDTRSIAKKTVEIMLNEDILGQDVFIDNFGIGANIAQEIALSELNENRRRVIPINVGVKSNDDSFLNIRSEAYWRLREWLIAGGQLIDHEGWQELLTIRFKKELSNKMKIMSKEEMRRHGYKSPDHVDALSLTFVIPETLQRASINRRPFTVQSQGVNRIGRIY